MIVYIYIICTHAYVCMLHLLSNMQPGDNHCKCKTSSLISSGILQPFDRCSLQCGVRRIQNTDPTAIATAACSSFLMSSNVHQRVQVAFAAATVVVGTTRHLAPRNFGSPCPKPHGRLVRVPIKLSQTTTHVVQRLRRGRGRGDRGEGGGGGGGGGRGRSPALGRPTFFQPICATVVPTTRREAGGAPWVDAHGVPWVQRWCS